MIALLGLLMAKDLINYPAEIAEFQEKKIEKKRDQPQDVNGQNHPHHWRRLQRLSSLFSRYLSSRRIRRAVISAADSQRQGRSDRASFPLQFLCRRQKGLAASRRACSRQVEVVE
ncbi:hypothetical protein [Bradyrhizobium sp. USDA 223]|uniref:hypothetical protein n=1 Tax=Bradyrhizobium sp. USDA 223 TaxID=3156306 RepID=UPI0038387CA5